MHAGVCTGFVVLLAISCYCIDLGIAKSAKSDNSNSMSGIASIMIDYLETRLRAASNSTRKQSQPRTRNLLWELWSK